MKQKTKPTVVRIQTVNGTVKIVKDKVIIIKPVYIN